MTDWTVDIGRYENVDKNGDPIRMILPVPGWDGAHWVVAGSSGSGKTETMRLMMARIAHEYRDQVAFAIADPHMVGFMEFVPRASVLGYGRGDIAIQVLRMVEMEHQRRINALFDKKIKRWRPEHIGLLGPYLILVVDEMAAITLAPPPRKEKDKDPEPTATTRLINLAQEARKTGIGLVLGAQSPKVPVINGLILEQCPIRWCGRTRRAEQTEAVLETRNYPCHLLDHPKGCGLDRPGTAWVDDGRMIRRGRSDAMSGDLFEKIANHYAADRYQGFGWPHEIQSGVPAGREEVPA